MSINVSSQAGVSSIPSSAEMGTFSAGLKGNSTTDLLKMLGQPGMESWQKDAIGKELQTRAENAQKSEGGDASGGSGGPSSDEIQKLLKKLENGSISDAEMKQLAGALGVPPAALEVAKGKGGDHAGGAPANEEIQGG